MDPKYLVGGLVLAAAAATANEQSVDAALFGRCAGQAVAENLPDASLRIEGGNTTGFIIDKKDSRNSNSIAVDLQFGDNRNVAGAYISAMNTSSSSISKATLPVSFDLQTGTLKPILPMVSTPAGAESSDVTNKVNSVVTKINRCISAPRPS